MEFLRLVVRACTARPVRQNATTYRRGREIGRSKAVVSDQLSVVSLAGSAVGDTLVAVVTQRIFSIERLSLLLEQTKDFGCQLKKTDN
jgi:hypothetical protein